MSFAIAALELRVVGVPAGDARDEEAWRHRVDRDPEARRLERGTAHEVRGTRLRRMYAEPIAGSTFCAAREVVTMMWPDPCGRMCLAAARTVAKMPFRLMSITRFQRSSV